MIYYTQPSPRKGCYWFVSVGRNLLLLMDLTHNRQHLFLQRLLKQSVYPSRGLLILRDIDKLLLHGGGFWRLPSHIRYKPRMACFYAFYARYFRRTTQLLIDFFQIDTIGSKMERAFYCSMSNSNFGSLSLLQVVIDILEKMKLFLF